MLQNKFLIIILIGITITIAVMLFVNKNQFKIMDNYAQAKRYGKMKITSASFDNNQSIPSKYTCDGADISPPLKIAEVPENTKSLALICDDPDAPMGTFVHWVMYNIPPKTLEIRENFPVAKNLPDGSIQAITDFRRVGYGGPCPPSGTHRYFFKLYALDKTLVPDSVNTKAELEKAMLGHIIEEAQLMGLYRRNR